VLSGCYTSWTVTTECADTSLIDGYITRGRQATLIVDQFGGRLLGGGKRLMVSIQDHDALNLSVLL